MDRYSSSVERRRKLPPLATLRAFEAAARLLSFQRAAAELGVTPTAISHHIRHLEEILGLPVFERHTRRVSLTPAGAHLLPPLTQGLDAIHEAIASLPKRDRRRAVTLTATTVFTAYRLVPGLAAFRERFPDIQLRLHASEAIVDLTDEIADAAIRYGLGPFPGLVSHPLSAELFGVVCNPSLAISEPDDLHRATLLHSEWHRRERVPDWRDWCARAGMVGLDLDAGPRFTDERHAIQAAIAGHGVTIASLFLLERELAAGLLVNPFGPTIAGDTYHFVAPAETMDRPDVQALLAWMLALG